MRDNLPTQKELCDHFLYDTATGIVIKRANGKEVGYKEYRSRSDGSKRPIAVVLSYRGRSFGAHRIIWCMKHGYFPENVIDHINRNPFDNRLENLREVTPLCNSRNSNTPHNSKTNIKGVSKVGKKSYFAKITVNRKVITLGFTKDMLEAVALRFAAEQCLDWHDCDASSSAGIVLKEAIRKNKEEGKDWSKYVVFDRYGYY